MDKKKTTRILKTVAIVVVIIVGAFAIGKWTGVLDYRE